MFEVKVRVKKLNLDNDKDIEIYEKILNDPLCTIIEERNEKLTEKIFDGKGKISNLTETFTRIVKWEEKTLI